MLNDLLSRFTRKQIVIILTSLFLLVIVVLVVISSNNNTETTGVVDQNKYVDPASGETVLSPEGKVPESEVNSDLIILGITKLLDIGISNNQMSQVELILEEYSKTIKAGGSKITEISFDVSSFKQNINQDTSEVVVTSKLIINRSINQSIKIVYYSFYDLYRVDILDESGKTIYIADPLGEE